MWRFDAASFTLELRALRPIQESEEITVSYTDIMPFASREDRRSYLAEGYGFQCQCTLCTLPDTQNKLFDALLQKLRIAVYDGSSQNSSPDPKKIAEAATMLKLMDKFQYMRPPAYSYYAGTLLMKGLSDMKRSSSKLIIKETEKWNNIVMEILMMLQGDEADVGAHKEIARALTRGLSR